MQFIEEDAFKNYKKIELVKCESKYLHYFNRRYLKTIIIINGVENIFENEFKECYNVNYIELPDSIKNIEEFSFNDCINLKKIKCQDKFLKYFNVEIYELPEEETIIKAEIFSDWKSLKKVKLHNKVENIECGAFENCISLQEIEIPNSIYLIPENTFFNCIELKKIIIPESVIDIHYSAFKGCNNLTDIKCPFNLKPKFETTLEINSLNIKMSDYCNYDNIEYIDIPYDAEVDDCFLNKFQFLKFVKCNPNLLQKLNKDIKKNLKAFFIPYGIKIIKNNMFKECEDIQTIVIPSSVNVIEEKSFFYCNNITVVKCVSENLCHFNKNNLETIFLFEETKIIKDDEFQNCENLRNIILPERFMKKQKILFQNCKKLLKIKYTNKINDNGINVEYRIPCEIPEGTLEIGKKNFENWENLNSISIPLSVNIIEDNTFSDCLYLKSAKLNPELIKYLCKERIEKITIPKEIEIIDETLFEGCINLKEIEFLGRNTLLQGKYCEDFNKILIIKAYPIVFFTLNEQLKEKIKIAIIPDDCEFIDEETFKNYKNLFYIDIPTSVKTIKNYAFEGCKNLEEITIPKSVLDISNNAFIGCENLVKLKCNPKFLNIFKDNKIKELTLTDNIIENDLNNLTKLKNFKYLEKINIPSKINKIPENILKDCTNLTQINCSPNLLKNLNNEDKQNIREIEIPNNQNIDNETLKGFDNVYNIQLPINSNLPFKKNEIHETSIEDLEKFDSYNKKYSNHIRNIISSINNGNVNFYGSPNSLEDISSNIAKVCLKIKTNSSKKFTPHPVQCLTVLRLADSLLNNKDNKGAIAEVKTGEGKSYIIAVLAIVLAKFYGKKIDVITSTVELARRDEADQREFYNLFKVKSGVLFDKNRDKDFFLSGSMIRNNDEDNQFNSEVFNDDIIYSTNSNFEFVYLFSLFRKKSIRSRPYDVVIVDEVDNMFLDQASSPAIIANSFPIKFSDDILEIVYIMQNYNLIDIKNTLQYYFPEDIANFTDKEIKKLKNAALIASKYEYKVDYIIENNEIVIIDKTTGYKKLGTRWQNFIHEMVEIKERLKIKSNQLSFCSITQSMFFNL